MGFLVGGYICDSDFRKENSPENQNLLQKKSNKTFPVPWNVSQEAGNNPLPPSLWLNKAEQWMGKMKLDGGEGPCVPWGWRARAPGWEKPENSTYTCSEPGTAALGMWPKQLSKPWTRRYKYLVKIRVLTLSWGGILHRNPLKTKEVASFLDLLHGRSNSIYYN